LCVCACSLIKQNPLSKVLSERIFERVGMPGTGFCVGPNGRQRAATMYQLGEDHQLRHDDTVRSGNRISMGPAPIADPPFCSGGAGLWSTVDDYLRFVRMLLDDGALDGARVLSEESVRLMRTDRLTD